MDGRWKRLVVGGILCGTMGCGFLRDKKPAWPGATGEPPVANSSKPVERRRGNDNEPIKVETLVALGNVRMQASADENRPLAERDDLQNQARLSYRQALQREPRNLEAMLGLARLYAVVKDKDKCLEWYQRASKAYPTNGEIMFETGKVLGAHFKDKDSAVTFMHAATKIDPENRKYRSELGFTLALAGRYEEAYAWISRVMPAAEAHYNLAGIMDHNGQPNLAKQHFALALQADPNYEKAKMAIAYYAKPDAGPIADNPVERVNYEQWTPLPVSSREPAAAPKQEPQTLPRMPSRLQAPASIQAPDPLPLNVTGPGAPSPSLVPTNGWDK